MSQNEWARLGPMELFGNVPGVAGTIAELALSGLSPAALGASPLDPTTRSEVPKAQGYAIDVSRPTEVDIVDSTGTTVCGAGFTDEHPPEWIHALSDAGLVVLLVTPKGISSYADWTLLLRDAHVVALPLAVRAWSDGIGIVPPAN